MGNAAGIADFGGKIINLQLPAVRLGPSATAGHETGHNLGLRHPDVGGKTGRGKVAENPIPGLGEDNFMGYGNGSKVDSRQIDLMQYYHDQGDLNGAHYGTDGRWKSSKSENEVFGKKRFEGGKLPGPAIAK